MSMLHTSHLHGVQRFRQGKVRDIYAVDDEHLLIVATDRLSAFDVVLPTPIPEKGRILTAMSNFWFARTASIVPNHLTTKRLEDVLPPDEARQVQERAVIVRRMQPLPVEAIVRGYIAGSAWTEYQQQGSVCGIQLPAGLRESERLPEPLFTPSTKAPVGEHDLNITFEEMVRLLDGRRALAERVRDVSLQVYSESLDYALTRGIILADTKFEFGMVDDQLYLIDEILTPDSSRFWPLAGYAAGQSQPSFDKQYVRDYLTSTGWDKRPPAPALPTEVVQQTTHKYQEALRVLTGLA
ncbi:MAG: phosphoribosylaminoimidazolesuccinocarboxamide synthase [Candidatus Tectomicrobia bacterium]|uniref:Phosphoribosylaminoimidazole-succinocarboxamide synthase n=1 Tax=Tectimicrobiota bacterium TaxID=2528274 RepID=A0A937W300_UNCTE|nr:phosphoribosylaminoimidazolesuccinocarboxamide synthase [Candidatus Tectomicrobia bacterium]